jgi:hypothetical protein
VNCTYRCLTPDGAQCELEDAHAGPHRNGLLIWHDPPVIFVGGKPYEPPTHGDLPAPNVEQLLEPDPEVYLAGGPLHDACKGGDECAAMCVCDRARDD